MHSEPFRNREEKQCYLIFDQNNSFILFLTLEIDDKNIKTNFFNNLTSYVVLISILISEIIIKNYNFEIKH